MSTLCTLLIMLTIMDDPLCTTALPTVERDAVEVLGAGHLCADLHAPADERLTKDVLHRLAEAIVVAQLLNHRDGVLQSMRIGSKLVVRVQTKS